MRKVKYGGREELRKMSSSPVSHGSKGSYEDESFETAEESLLGDGSPVVWGRQESVFLAESSSSSFAEDSGQKSQAFGGASMSESCETILSESKAGSESIKITEECGYSDQFESIASLTDEAEEELSTKVDTSSETEENESKDFFIRRKLEVLSSNQSGLGKMHYLEKRDHEDKIIDDHNEMNNFCSRKLKIMALNKHEKDKGHCVQETVLTAGQPVEQPISGNKRRIESLKIENLMNKTEKFKQRDFHNPRHCSDCRALKSDIAKNTFLKRKLEIVKRAEFEERLQTHMYQKDSATLIAKIANSCTKATAPANQVWEKLLRKGGNR